MGPIEPVGYIVMDGDKDLCARCATLEFPELDSEFSRVNEKAIHDDTIFPLYYFDYDERDYEVFCESCGAYLGGQYGDDDDDDDETVEAEVSEAEQTTQ